MKRLLLLALLSIASACSGDRNPDDTARAASPIELSSIGTVFGLATSLSDERGADPRSREAASLATGGLRVKLNEGGAPWTTAEGTRVGASCGVTFVAPSFAVTAAHCVDGNELDDSDIVVDMFRPTLALNEGFRAATVVSGTYPEYDHGRLDGAQGYFTDRFSCQVVARCGDAYIPFACDASVSDFADTALLECEGRPGEQYGYLDVATTDDMGAEVFMPWKHEIYDLEASSATELLGRYAELPTSLADNYHYHSVSSTGLENHQLLPLISVPYAPDTPHQKLSSGSNGVTTDMLGCHGTSGSGALQRGEHGLWQLLGPARYGEAELGYYLCNHIPALTGPEHVSGGSGVGYTALMPTQHVVSQLRESITLDCPALPSGATTLLTHLDCPRQNLAAQLENAAFAALLGSAEAPSPLDTLGGWVVSVAEGAPVAFTGFTVGVGESYRFGIEGAATGGCAVGNCPELVVSAEGRELLRSSAFATSGANTNFAVSFTATTTGTLEFGFTVRGGAIELGALSLVPVDHLIRFDQVHERLGAVLIDTAEPDATPNLMRFVGDGVEGFEARLLPSERMVLPHLAIHTGLELLATFSATTGAALACGLLGADLAPLAEVDCSTGTATLPAAGTAETADTARGLYIENLSTSSAVLVDDLRIVTSEPVDSDADGLVDSVDDCPTGGMPTQGALLALSTALEQELCVPAPSMVDIALPKLSTLAGCELEIVSAELSSAQGRALGEPIPLDLAAPRVKLGPGTHTITWSFRVLGGSEEATYEQELALTHSITAACCASDLTVWEGSAADESHYAATPVCALAGDGADVVRGSSLGDWLWGAAGSDFLSGELGNDVVLGGDGDDVLSGGVDGHATIYAGPGDDTIQLVHAASSLVYAGFGADTVVGSSGDDTVYPGPGASEVLTGDGSDTVVLLDDCEVTAGMVLDGGEGEDTLRSPLTLAKLEARGVTVRSFETVFVDTSQAHLAECFGSTP